MQGQNLEKVVGFYPFYKEGSGKGSIILYNDGLAQENRRSIRSLLQGIATVYAVDLTAARRQGGEVAGRKNEIPLPFTPQLIMVPLRACKPVASHDGAIGYFSLFAITGVESKRQGPFRSELSLQGEHRVSLLQGRETVEKQLFLAQLVYKEYMFRHSSGESILADMGEKPATKRDIALLIHELWDLRYRILGVRG